MPDAPDKEKMEQVSPNHTPSPPVCYLEGGRQRADLDLCVTYKIRQRRLAKLGSSNPVSQTTDGGNSSSAGPSSPAAASSPGLAKSGEPEVKRTKINITSAAPSPASLTSTNPFTQLGVGSGTSTPTSGTKLERKRLTPGPDVNRPSGTTMPPARRHVPESFEDWADKTISQIFRVTVDDEKQTDVHGRKLTFLPGVRDELLEQNPSGPFRLSSDVMEQAILEAGSAFPHEKPLMDYMLPCWKRVIQAKKSLRAPTPEKEAVLLEAKRMCMSYCLFALTLPNLFGYVAIPTGQCDLILIIWLQSRQ